MRGHQLDRLDRDDMWRTGKDMFGVPIRAMSPLQRNQAYCPGCKKVKHKDEMLGGYCEACIKKKDKEE